MADSTLLGGAWRTNLTDQKTTITSAAETAISPALAAGILTDLYLLVISNRSAVDTDVTVRDAVGGATRFGPATVKAGLQAGFAMSPVAALKQPASGTWTAQCSVGVTAIEITTGFIKSQS